ncbi:MAG: UDP-N-acetylmuramoyl-L-alanyl-D-glutamate--2,6-diaminopimelate ligase [Defluviitaleaceae bacterium]|nr:UDP-N-acetylmuramoyl-L-alanyl-D-glutamate--2,6-diaminopimelate ligase [Defluviitaleaceae bacterium]
MKLSEVLNGLNLDITNIEEAEITGISIDSRKVCAGDLYVCIEGLNVDGHDFAVEAISRGAAALLCSRALEISEILEVSKISETTEINIPQVITENTRLALCTICHNFYNNPAKNMKVIGITGTNGKTSTLSFMEQILRQFGKSVGSIGTFGAKINGEILDIPFATATTPDTIELYKILCAMEDANCEYVVMEVSSHALALDKVMALRFALGLFTNLSQDHLDFHGSMEEYKKAKSLLFSLCDHGIINSDDDAYEYLKEAAKCPITTYGIESGDFLARNISLEDYGVEYTIGDTAVCIDVPGKFSIYNSLCAFVAAITLGFETHVAAAAISKLEGVPGRIQHIPNNHGLTVIVDYAHTPDGLENIIAACREFTPGRIITVFGCGGDRDSAKRPIMGGVAGSLSDLVIITSDNPRNENPENIIAQIEKGIASTHTEYLKITDRKEAVFAAVSVALPLDCVIIAGKGHENYQEFENKRRIKFDDIEIAKEAFEKLH